LCFFISSRFERKNENQREIIMTEENKAEQTGSITTFTNELQSSRTASDMTDTHELQSTRTQGQQAADDLKSAAGPTGGEYSGDVEQTWGDVRDAARTFQADADKYVRENPTKAVFIALGVGFVLGFVFRR
jgi:ElaB/YqjD/DUF883 family membrane-anchored ribosome-binding protein